MRTDDLVPALPLVEEFLRRASGLRICVVGDVMIDEYVVGRVDRLSPEAAVPVLRVGNVTSGLGGAGNLARGIAALGAAVELFGVIGDDDAGTDAVDLALAAGISGGGILRQADRQTTVKRRLMERGRQLARVDYEDQRRISDEAAQRILRDVQSMHADAIAVSDYGKGVVTPELFGALAATARDAGVPLLVDPTTVDPHVYRGATLVKANLLEFTHLASTLGHRVRYQSNGTNPPDGSELSELATQVELVRAALDWQHLFVTVGGDGVVVASEDDSTVRHVPTRPVEVSDESGAGDTVLAVVTLARAAGLDTLTSAMLGNLAARSVVARSGVVAAGPADLARECRSAAVPVVGEQILIDLCERWRANGETIAFTNGCFDLLHAGHIHLLRAAAQLADRLVVAVDTDESVRELKGLERPILDGDVRRNTVASVSGVDAVVAFHHDGLDDLIHAVQPDVLVKGADYNLAQVVGARTVQERGGRVQLIPLLAGQSTTSLSDRLGPPVDPR
ncbi:MAG: PfkB family carbohydrate kinase [Actinomycetes bacterium]